MKPDRSTFGMVRRRIQIKNTTKKRGKFHKQKEKMFMKRSRKLLGGWKGIVIFKLQP